jgi:hypothetical protein
LWASQTLQEPAARHTETSQAHSYDMTEEILVRGCRLINLAQNMSTVVQVFREKMKVVIDDADRYLRKAQNSGYLKKNLDTHQIAVFLVIRKKAHSDWYRPQAVWSFCIHFSNALRVIQRFNS